MAKAKKTVNDLSFFSYDYQCSILKLFMEKEEFALATVDTMDQNHFSAAPELRKIAGIIKEKVSKLNRKISYDELELWLKTSIDDAITLENCIAIINEKVKKNNYNESELNTIKDEYHRFLTAMETVKLGNEISERNKNGATKDDIMLLVKQYDDRTTFGEISARHIDISQEHLYSLADDDTCEVVPTGCNEIDEKLGGGMRKGDFGILVAGTGIGKTCVTSGFATYAAWKGYKVAHIVLEDKPDDIDAKYMGYLLNIPVNSFRGKIATEEWKKEYKRRVNDKSEALEKRFWPNIARISAIDKDKKIHPVTTRDIDNELTKLENSGFIPDLVIVDYFDKIKPTIRNLEIHQKDQIISDELSELAVNHNVAMWVPSQGNKSVQDRATKINISNMSGGAWKGFTAQIVVSMQRDMEDLSTKASTVQFLKNRYNNDFTPIYIEFDNGTCRFGSVLNDDKPIYGDGEDKVADEVYDEHKRKK